MSARLPMLACAFALASPALHAAPPNQDPDWPCMQRLVPSLTAGTFWSRPLAVSDWRSDPLVSGLVTEVAPRSVSARQGEARIAAFLSGIMAADRAAMIGKAFAGLLDETNRQRSEVIDSLRALTRRQRGMADVVARVTSELRALPSEADFATRDEVTQRRALLMRQFDETERTVRYACEVPAELEGRLGAYARTFQQMLDQLPVKNAD